MNVSVDLDPATIGFPKPSPHHPDVNWIVKKGCFAPWLIEGASERFYVDDQCIDCDLCRDTAPANFARDHDGEPSFVYKQPKNAEEEALCREAMEGCPVEAIGDDGE